MFSGRHLPSPSWSMAFISVSTPPWMGAPPSGLPPIPPLSQINNFMKKNGLLALLHATAALPSTTELGRCGNCASLLVRPTLWLMGKRGGGPECPLIFVRQPCQIKCQIWYPMAGGFHDFSLTWHAHCMPVDRKCFWALSTKKLLPSDILSSTSVPMRVMVLAPHDPDQTLPHRPDSALNLSVRAACAIAPGPEGRLEAGGWRLQAEQIPPT